MNSPLVSVIIPTRNRLGFLREAVASVLSQSLTDWELIVVDDCSEDGTWDWLGSLKDARIRTLRMEEHRERSAARNAGLAAARGEYILFLDDDDWLLGKALDRLSDALRREPQAVGAIGAYIYKNDWGSWNRVTHPRRRHFKSIWPDLLFGWIPMPGQVLLRRSAVIDAGGWNEAMSLSEDPELWLRLWRHGHAVVIPQPVLAFRTHPGQTSRAGAWALNIELRRRAVAGQREEERQRADRMILADRLVRLVWRSNRRGRPVQGLRWWWKAVLSAPWLLASAPSRAILCEAGRRCLVGALNPRLAGSLRKAKRACVRTFRGELRPPRSDSRPTKVVRSVDGRA